MEQIFIEELKERYGIVFNNIALLEEAFTHSSYANEHRNLALKDNERLEFLGDAVMELTVSEFLYNKYPDWPEGKLTRLRAAIVCTASFSSFAHEAHFDQFVRLGKGEEKSGARNRDTLLEDLFEAFNGALFLDQGRGAVIEFAKKMIFPKINAGQFSDQTDFKTNLQEYLQQAGEVEISYELLKAEGPSHNRRFEVNVIVNGQVIGHGIGHNKKTAEQAAAKEALETFKKAD